MEEIKDIINTMEVPEMRRTDLKWLLRNLAFKNSNHMQFEKVMRLIRLELIKTKQY